MCIKNICIYHNTLRYENEYGIETKIFHNEMMLDSLNVFDHISMHRPS